MVSFEDVNALLMPTIPRETAVSLPVPATVGGRRYDLFFTYSVDYFGGRVERPMTCLAVSPEEQRVVDVGDAFGFSALPFEGADTVPIPDYLKLLLEARDLYGRVREEAAAGERGEATRRYIQLVEQTSQPCLLPWYRALGLYGTTDSQTKGDS